jgi:alkanesulfonate monooxygenase SsuD/methylene tetrahydromethanopterin reductase-like flavin-dependent oxidoreductase (luciferase family)
MGVGTGEALNEVPFLDNNEWPPWQERIDRLVEGIGLIRKFWESKDYFDFRGKYFKMKQVYPLHQTQN